MSSHRFSYCYPAAFCLTLLCAPVASAGTAPPQKSDELQEQAIKLPPRSINDITRMLSDYRQQDDLVTRLQGIADAPAPQGSDKKTLFDFYWQRAMAAGQLGRVQQQLSDFRLAVEHGSAGTPEFARALRNLAGAEFSGG